MQDMKRDLRMRHGAACRSGAVAAAVSGLEDQVSDWCHGITSALRLGDPKQQGLLEAVPAYMQP